MVDPTRGNTAINLKTEQGKFKKERTEATHREKLIQYTDDDKTEDPSLIHLGSRGVAFTEELDDSNSGTPKFTHCYHFFSGLLRIFHLTITIGCSSPRPVKVAIFGLQSN
ncbi:9849_t:CDS:2 [Funneliformis caledonium]|uniref:9849_t:CDS:1 n=1 Tax=Funneliformis caledonium TaxID=1117310 RepID=A0A9N8UZX2_9GLOM|nr:9849_t:CDS:2 [Funneliformis caledonium]